MVKSLAMVESLCDCGVFLVIVTFLVMVESLGDG